MLNYHWQGLVWIIRILIHSGQIAHRGDALRKVTIAIATTRVKTRTTAMMSPSHQKCKLILLKRVLHSWSESIDSLRRRTIRSWMAPRRVLLKDTHITSHYVTTRPRPPPAGDLSLCYRILNIWTTHLSYHYFHTYSFPQVFDLFRETFSLGKPLNPI